MCRYSWRVGRRESILQVTCSVLASAVSAASRRSAGPVAIGGVPPAQDGCLLHARRFYLTRQCIPHPMSTRLLAGELLRMYSIHALSRAGSVAVAMIGI